MSLRKKDKSQSLYVNNTGEEGKKIEKNKKKEIFTENDTNIIS